MFYTCMSFTWHHVRVGSNAADDDEYKLRLGVWA